MTCMCDCLIPKHSSELKYERKLKISSQELVEYQQYQQSENVQQSVIYENVKHVKCALIVLSMNFPYILILLICDYMMEKTFL